MARYNTNLASEFYVLSVLHRLGLDAYLTLGSKKAIDIVVGDPTGSVVTVDVKGVAGRDPWPAGNIRKLDSDRHFYVLVSYLGNIGDPKSRPRVWIVPSTELSAFIKEFRTRSVVYPSLLRKDGDQFEDAWHLLAEASAKAPTTREKTNGR